MVPFLKGLAGGVIPLITPAGRGGLRGAVEGNGRNPGKSHIF